ncbi:unspecific monooxygenase [Sarracenia purpurea var. burkii]
MGYERSFTTVFVGVERSEASERRHPSGQGWDPQRNQHVDRRRVDAPRPSYLGRQRERVPAGEVQRRRHARRLQPQDGLPALRVRGRMCVGRNLTVIEYKIVLTPILTRFSLSLSLFLSLPLLSPFSLYLALPQAYSWPPSHSSTYLIA